jgi:hypothetical protein
MKSMVVTFERQTYTSKPDGTACVVVSADNLRTVLGAAKSIRLQWIGFRMSADCEVKLKAWESSYSGLRPSELAQGAGTPYFTSNALTVLRPAPENVTSGFGGNVEVTMEVRNSGSPGNTLVEADGMVAATLIMEE